MSNNNHLLKKFLDARALIDRDTVAEISKGKEQKNVMDKPSDQHQEDSVRMIIETKPSKKKVMEFLKRRIALLTDETSSDMD